jgi:hypothetical protein
MAAAAMDDSKQNEVNALEEEDGPPAAAENLSKEEQEKNERLKIERKQFPLRLAYSMTYNKSQGQEFEQALVDIRNPPFTHGHLYVSLSRVRIAKNVRLFTNPPIESALSGTTVVPPNPPDPPIVTNVVYEMLRL